MNLESEKTRKKGTPHTIGCPVCGLAYVGGLPEDERLHDRVHARAARAQHDFALAHPDLPELPISYAAREAMKHPCGGVKHVLAHFARSWEGVNYSRRHPSFEAYARAMLVSPRMRLIYGEDLARRYPPKTLPGLDPGYSYWEPPHDKRLTQDNVLADSSEPICVFCGKGTTPERLVEGRVRGRASHFYYAHSACANRNIDKPIPRSRHNERLKTVSLTECLSAWNALIDEFEGLLADVPMDAACNVWNASVHRKTRIGEAIADRASNARFMFSGCCRTIKWHVERLKAAIERDGGRSLKRGVVDFDTTELSLPVIDEVRRRYAVRVS
jgi:hypothetical protein